MAGSLLSRDWRGKSASPAGFETFLALSNGGLDRLNQDLDSRPIRCIRTAVSEHQPALRVQHEVAAQLNQVIALLGPERHPTSEYDDEVPSDHQWIEKAQPGCAAQLKDVIRLPCRIAQDGKRQRMLVKKRRCLSRRRETDVRYLPTELLDLRISLLHLPEVRQASQSGEIAEEHENQCFGVKIT